MKFALFEDTIHSQQVGSYLFSDPLSQVIVSDPELLFAGLQQIDELSQQGLYLCGYIAYPALFALEKKLRQVNPDSSDCPLLHFVAYRSVKQFASSQLASILQQQNIAGQTQISQDKPFSMVHLQDNYPAYQTKFKQIIHHLRQGDSYQVNLTLPVALDSRESDLFKLYYQLSRSHPVNYSAYLPFSPYSVVSISPELFFKKVANTISVRPMKGTMPRGLNPEQDRHNFAELAKDQKNLAENLIIVDLLRNDLAKFCVAGSIKVQNLFQIEKYASVYQMTSSLAAQLAPTTTFSQIIQQLFPCGSISGAPKLSTLQIIENIEQYSRNIYSGAIGYILPNNDMQFNVAIRTLSARADKPQQLQLGVGGGITIQSTPTDEWQELKTKLNFISKHYQPDFELIESLGYSKGKLHNLELHLIRLENSAQQLGFNYNLAKIQQQLQLSLATLDSHNSYKLRLELAFSGELSISTQQIPLTSTPLRIAIHQQPIDSSHPLFLHKSNSPLTRGLYQRLDKQAKPDNIDELIFINQEGYLTESRHHNLIIDYQGQWLTPALKHGLLGGICRQELLARAKLSEADLVPAMLVQAAAIYLCNDVRGVIGCNYHPADISWKEDYAADY